MSVAIPDETKTLLWVKAGGRCEYCNAPLWKDTYTMTEMNAAYIAHIRAVSRNGPRWHPVLSKKLKKDISNLMLLCDKHHRKIDNMDILPAISNSQKTFLAREAGISPTIPPIWIADEKLQKWLPTNPKGYAAWFKNRTRDQFETEMRKVALFREAKIEAVPLNKIKTPLQRSIQILKRHRDMIFIKDQKGKPISMIIATLAAHFYNNEPDIVEALQSIVPKIQTHVNNLKGLPYVPNPACPDEDFADKWQDNPQLRENFISWVGQFQEDFDKALQQREVDTVAVFLERPFGEKMVKAAFAEAFEPQSVNIKSSEHTPPLVNITNRPNPWGL